MKRIQRQRTKGWRMPDNAVYVGRPSVWGNPFEIGCRYRRVNGVPQRTLFDAEAPAVKTRTHAVQLYREWMAAEPERTETASRVLHGYDLACWCPLDQPCHADVLLELAAMFPEKGRAA